MEMGFKGLGMLMAALIVLVGCVGIKVDEARVFQPQPVANKAQNIEDTRLEWQDIFERASNFTLTNNINNDHSTIKISKDEFFPADLNHTFWADGTIAVTEFTTGQADRPLVVHCGGNASDRHNSGTLFGLKVLPYADLIVFDYPGYGDSPGVPSAQSFETMIDALADELNASKARSERPLILWGYSLGGFVCSQLLGALEQADGIIIESSASDSKSAARQLVPAILRPFLRVRLSPSLAAYSNIEALQAYKGKILILAGAKDGILPARLSQQLVDGLEEKGVSVTYHEFVDGNHANLPTVEGYAEALTAFFAQW